jgi:hypothetical protein
MFGGLPSVSFMGGSKLLVSELLYTDYFSYYIMIPGVGLALFLRQRARFQHYIAVLSFVFYVCYLLYLHASDRAGHLGPGARRCRRIWPG